MGKYKNTSARPITIKSVKGKIYLIPGAVKSIEVTKDIKEYIDALVKAGDLVEAANNTKQDETKNPPMTSYPQHDKDEAK